MSNILPKEAKKAVWNTYRARFIVAGSFTALFVASLCALSLLPSYLALHAGDVAGVPTSTSTKAVNDADRSAIASIRTILTSLSPVLVATTTPTAAITKVLSLRPSTITIDHLTYSGDEPGTLVVTGSAATREAINGYRQALSSDPLFKMVSIPIGDLTGEPGARFSLTLSGAF
ncbi:hypothetical protein HY971_02515 [Candidatus Kaiserbacteria bacterium]|nr:hypothetical protein [Candidatus Kaiserbacteria bacterium]